MVEFVAWLREWNARNQNAAGIYGMDLYSMHRSIESVLEYLDKNDPSAARRARDRYACFEHFSLEPQLYAQATVIRGKEPCDDEVTEQLVALRANTRQIPTRACPRAAQA